MILKREIREIVAPISKAGTDYNVINSIGYGGHASAKDFAGNQRPEDFSPTTVIINGGHGEWELKIPEEIRRQMIDATLKIETVRTHGMLHSPNKNSVAKIFINGELLDKIYLVKPHPHGTDFGVDTRRPIPVFDFINKNDEKQTVRIEVDKDTFWNIDRITLEPIILRNEWKPEATMIIGAIISAIIGAIASVVLAYYLLN